MVDSTRVPYLLNPYLQTPPESSLLLIGNMLNATSNWLLLQYLVNTCRTTPRGVTALPNVVFVSFLRDWEFWRDGSRRMGLDLNQAISAGRLIYIDGLSGLFSPKANNFAASGSPVVLRTNGNIESVDRSILAALLSLSSSSESKPMLIIDGLDFLLAATHTSATELLASLMTWRETAQSTILSLSIDSSLLHTRQTPLETNHAILVTSLVHQAHLVLNLRLLSTGAAKDVSGVLQATRGGASDQHNVTIPVEEKEVLYLVSGDGNVKVFERGSG